jgi:hypothetical protein
MFGDFPRSLVAVRAKKGAIGIGARVLISAASQRDRFRGMSGYGMVACGGGHSQTVDVGSVPQWRTFRPTRGWSRSYFDAASQITHLFWLYRPGARPIGVYVLAAPPCGVHKRSIAALPMYP